MLSQERGTEEMTDHELVDKTVEIIVRAYRDEKIDFTGYGSQCDWIGYQVRHLYMNEQRLPEREGQLRFSTDNERRDEFFNTCRKNGSEPVKNMGRYCFS